MDTNTRQGDLADQTPRAMTHDENHTPLSCRQIEGLHNALIVEKWIEGPVHVRVNVASQLCVVEFNLGGALCAFLENMAIEY